MTMTTPAPTALATNRGKLILALLCAVGFLDFIDVTIVNVALPSIRSDLGFSVQELQWVPSGYLLTYGGFMLLGGRAADLLGRRRVLVAGIVLFGIASLIGGFADTSQVLVSARLIQGIGAAMTLPAALSVLTTTFQEGADRHTALGTVTAPGCSSRLAQTSDSPRLMRPGRSLRPSGGSSPTWPARCRSASCCPPMSRCGWP
mgnify:CR=1 FL=1